MSEGIALALEWAAAGVTAAGAFFYLAAAAGLMRLPDFFCRMHAPTKAATLGATLLALGSALGNLASGSSVRLKDLLIVLFLFLTMPVSAQILMRAAAARGIPQAEGTRGRGPIHPVESVEEAGELARKLTKPTEDRT